eukprot:6492531-Amphidinium_carterae.3
MQQKRRVKDAKLVEVQVETTTGMETCYVFKDTSAPHRRLKLRTLHAEELEEQILHPDEHVHEEQGKLMMKMAVQQRLKENCYPDVLAAGSGVVCSIEEYKNKLNKDKKPSGKQGAVASASKKRRGVAPLGAMLCDKSAEESSSSSEDSDADDDDDENDNEKSEGECGTAEDNLHQAVSQALVVHKSPTVAEPKKKTPQKLLKGVSSKSLQCKGQPTLPSGGGSDEGEGADEDDDGQSSAVVIPENASNSTVVNTWMAKLNLAKILDGHRLGRQAYWAQDAASKLEAKYQLQLTNHIALSNKAAIFHKGVVESKSLEDLRDAISSLQAKVAEWPAHLQELMFKRERTKVIESIKQNSRSDDIKQFLAMVRPYAVDAADAKQRFNMLEPKLAHMKGVARPDVFMDVVMGELILPSVLEGEQKVSKTKWILKELLPQLEEDMLLEIESKEAVAALREVQDGLLGLKGLLSNDMLEQVECKEHVQKFKKHMGTCSNHPLADVANAIQQEKYYKQHFDTFMSMVHKWTVHEKRILLAQTFVRMTRDDVPADAKALESFCREYSILQSEMPSFTKDLDETIQRNLMDAWSKLQSQLESEGGGQEVGAELQAFLAEASICFPEAQCFNDAQLSLSEQLSSNEAAMKLDGMVEKLMDFRTKFTCKEEDDASPLAALLEAVEAAKGVTAKSDDQGSEVKTCVVDILNVMETAWNSEQGIAQFALKAQDL